MLFDAFRLTHTPRKHDQDPRQVAPNASSAPRDASFPPSPPQTTTVAAGAGQTALPKLPQKSGPALEALAAFASGKSVCTSSVPRARLLARLYPVHPFADAAVVVFVTMRKTPAVKIRVRVRVRTNSALALRAPWNTDAGSRGRFVSHCKRQRHPSPKRRSPPILASPQPLPAPTAVILSSLCRGLSGRRGFDFPGDDADSPLLSLLALWGPVTCLHTLHLLFSRWFVTLLLSCISCVCSGLIYVLYIVSPCSYLTLCFLNHVFKEQKSLVLIKSKLSTFSCYGYASYFLYEKVYPKVPFIPRIFIVFTFAFRCKPFKVISGVNSVKKNVHFFLVNTQF